MSIYIADDIIFIVNKNKVINKKFKSIDRGFIKDKELFMEEFLKLLKQEKIRIKILGDKIEFVWNTYFKESDKFFIDNIFLDLGFAKVEYVQIKDYFDRDAIYMEVNNTYLVINFNEGIYLDLTYFKDIPKILEYFQERLDKDIILFGKNKDIPLIKVDNKNIYYLQNKNSYITDCLLQVKKYGV